MTTTDDLPEPALVLRYRVLGPLTIWRGGDQVTVVPAQQRAVMAGLLLRAGTRVSAETLIDDVWGSEVPRSAVFALRNYVHWLRRLLYGLGADPISTISGGYRMELAPDALDLTRFERLIAEARALQTEGRAQAAVDCYARGLRLWAGPALDDVPGPYAEQQRARLTDLRLQAVEEHAACLLEAGDAAGAAASLAALAPEHALHEQLVRTLMVALYRTGRRADALAAYRTTTRLLAEELGVQPGHALRQLHERMLRGDPALDMPATGLALVRTPPKPVHAPAHLPVAPAVFVGRAEQCAEALKPLPTPVLVHGPAGVGKTAFALHVAHRLKDRFPDGQLYAAFGGSDLCHAGRETADVLAQFLEALGIDPARIPADPSARACLYRSLLAGRRVLLVLDDARSADQVRLLLPASPGCLALVTTRSRLLGLLVTHQARSIMLAPFDTQEAHEYLAHTIGSQRTDAEPEPTARIAAACAGLPLALAVAGARAADSPHSPLAKIAHRLESSDGLDAFVLGHDPAVDVRAAFFSSYQALEAWPARLFRLLSVHPGPHVVSEAAAALLGVSTSHVTAALRELAAVHLLTEPEPGRYTLHALLRVYAAELSAQYDSAQARAEARLRLFDYCARAAYAATQLIHTDQKEPALPALGVGAELRRFDDAAQAEAWLSAHRPMLRVLAEDVAAGRECAHRWRLGWGLDFREEERQRWSGVLGGASAMLRVARAQRDRILAACAHLVTAQAELHLHNLPSAVRHGQVARRLLPPDATHVIRGEAHLLLAWIFTETGADEAALEHALASLEVHRAANDRYRMMLSCTSVGWAYAHNGEYEACLTMCKQALELLDTSERPTGRAAILCATAYAHRRFSHTEQAREDLSWVVTLLCADGLKGAGALILERLAEIHEDTGEADAATACRRQARAIQDATEHLRDGALRYRLEADRVEI